MNTATPLPGKVPGSKHHATHYRMSPPLMARDVRTGEEVVTEYVVVSDAPPDPLLSLIAALAQAGEPPSSTLMIATDALMSNLEARTKAEDVTILFGATGFRDHSRALRAFGYEIAPAVEMTDEEVSQAVENLLAGLFTEGGDNG